MMESRLFSDSLEGVEYVYVDDDDDTVLTSPPLPSSPLLSSNEQRITESLPG